MTTKQQISDWFDEGVRQKATHMLIICDTFDYGDYPKYAFGNQDCLDKYKNPGEMQRVMEVYNLADPKQEQLNARRTIKLPKWIV